MMQVVLDRFSRLLLFATMIVTLVGASLPGAAIAQEATPAAECISTTPEENRELVRTYWDEDVWGPEGKVAELVSPDLVHHWAAFDKTASFEEFTATRGRFLAAFPGVSIDIDLLAAQDDLVASAWTATGTHTGEWQGIAPTNKEVIWEGINIFRIECGKIAETWSSGNLLALLAQLGAEDVPAFLADTIAEATPVVEIASTPCADDSPEAKLNLARRWTNEVWTGQDLDVLDEIASPDIVHHGGDFPDTHGVEALKEGVRAALAAHPDMTLGIEAAFTDGDLVVVRWSGTGTNLGEFLGHSPSGEETTIAGINIYRVHCGQIVESWSEINGLDMLRQIQEANAAATPAA